MEDNIFLMVPRLITHYTRPSHVEKEIMKGVSDETRRIINLICRNLFGIKFIILTVPPAGVPFTAFSSLIPSGGRVSSHLRFLQRHDRSAPTRSAHIARFTRDRCANV